MWRPWEASTDSNSDNNIAEREESAWRRHEFSSNEKQIVLNVFECLKNKKPESSRRGLVAETSSFTKISKRSIWRILKSRPNVERKKRKDSGTTKALTEADYDLVRRKIYELYRQKIIVTSEVLQQKLVTDGTEITVSLSTLRTVMHRLGFRYKTINKRQILMESRRLVNMRSVFLSSINRFRQENRTLVFLDETWFDTYDTIKKGWTDSSKDCYIDLPSNRGKRIIILCAGSENGWVCEPLLSCKSVKDSGLDYHQDMTAELFEKWFEEKLLPSLPNNSVIILDNAPYHSRQTRKIPNRSSTKEEIKEFLYENDIYFEECHRKNDLLEIVRSFSLEKTFFIDEKAKEKGHIVLRLPPYYCVLNPIELVWANLKHNIRKNNDQPKMSAATIDLIKKEIGNITPDIWRSCIARTKKVEEEYNQIQNEIPPIVINTGNDMTSSDSDEF